MKVPPGQLISQVKTFAGKQGQHGKRPAPLTPDSALGYVVNESYAALKRFEEDTPDSQVRNRILMSEEATCRVIRRLIMRTNGRPDDHRLIRKSAALASSA